LIMYESVWPGKTVAGELLTERPKICAPARAHARSPGRNRTRKMKRRNVFTGFETTPPVFGNSENYRKNAPPVQ
jgi:hypothetical protein